MDGGNAGKGGGGRARKRRRRGGGGRGGGGGGGGGQGGGGRGGGGFAAAPPQPPAAAVAPLASMPAAGTAGGGNALSRTSSTTLSQMTASRFDALPGVSPQTLDALATVLRYETMTKVQAQATPVCLTGSDVLAKAKTGTGKTLAFMIPGIEAVSRIPAAQRRGGISCLVISPTRELAQQIAAEAGQLNSRHGFGMQCIYGGSNIKSDLSAFRRQLPDILVATPGRLNDHLENHGLADKMRGLRVLIFDEADQLLEMGFRPAITQMLRMLPPKDTRQTLLFSATMPPDVMGIARFALRDRFEHVDCVGKEQATHQHVPQELLVHSIADQFSELLLLMREGAADPNFKIMVFFTTARLTQFFSELFNHVHQMGGFPSEVLEIHSRKSQPHRNRVSKQFRDSQNAIMFSSDVSARGMDYPDVTKVVQVGLPSDRAQYIHRLGRTARAGRGGAGVLLLCDFEAHFANKLKDLPIKTRPSSSAAQLQEASGFTSQATRRIPDLTHGMAYQAWLGFYNSHLRSLGWSQRELVERANSWACDCCGLAEPPSLQAKTVGKMGLKGVPGLRVEGRGGVPHREAKAQQGGGGGGRGGGGGGRGGGGGGGG
eukprot:g5261.t1